jgi:flagellar motor switch protein FliM
MADDDVDQEDKVVQSEAGLPDNDGDNADRGDVPTDLNSDAELDDDVAAEWAAMIDDEDVDDSFGADGGSGRVLDQDEIDSLLGFDSDREDERESTGVRAIINSALVSYERLPMLDIVFDRLVRMMSTSLRNFTSDNVERYFGPTSGITTV